MTVIVTGFVGPYSEQIRVVGEAAKPQYLPYKNKMTILDVMIAVGGITDQGNSLWQVGKASFTNLADAANPDAGTSEP